MKTTRYILALALLVAPAALSQVAGQPAPAASSPGGSVDGPPPVTIAATVTPPPCVKNTSFYAAGASFNRAATPNLAGLFAVGVPLTCSTSSFQVYSFTEHTVVPVGSGANLSFKDTTTSGFATPLKQFGPFSVFVFGSGGVSTNQGDVSAAGAYGGFVAFPLAKNTAWRGLISAQKVANNNIYSVLVGREF